MPTEPPPSAALGVFVAVGVFEGVGVCVGVNVAPGVRVFAVVFVDVGEGPSVGVFVGPPEPEMLTSHTFPSFEKRSVLLSIPRLTM